MSHAYPLASSAADALDAPEQAARTRYDADRLADETQRVVGLETEWLTVEAAEVEAICAKAEASAGDGFVQRYENADGSPVLAVTYWRLVPQFAGMRSARPKKKAPAMPPEEKDHTDDLYFRHGRTRSRRRKPDPRQLDLFQSEDANEDVAD